MSNEKNTILVELTPDELELVERWRAEYTIIKKGVSHSEKPRYVHMDIDTPEHRVIYDLPKTGDLQIIPKNRNPDKKSFGVIRDLYNRLEFCCYKQTFMNHFLVYLNGQKIQLPPDQWRNLFRLTVRIGNFYGFMGKKRKLNRVKFR